MMTRRLLCTILIATTFNASCQSIVSFETVPVKNNTYRKWVQGWITVEENRTKSQSNKIRLPFILSLSSNSLDEDNAPILIMSGGPGNSSLNMANGIVNTIWGRKRDILIMEQRGTTFADPSLRCPEIDSLRVYGMNNKLWGSSLDKLKLKGAKLCFQKFIKGGVDLLGYNTLESVHDIEELRNALKIDKMILYGMSYSCKLMTAYSQIYPERTKGLILDSPLPHQVKYDEEAFENIDTVLKNVIKNYTGSLSLYEEWKDYIYSVRDSVFSLSFKSRNIFYTKNELIDVVMFKLSGHQTIKSTPNSIKRIVEGDHGEVSNIIDYYLKPSEQSLGMRYSLWITEELSDQNQDSINVQRERFEWLKDYSPNDISFETQKVWELEPILKFRAWPTTKYLGNVLILSGEFDPWTPVRYGIQMKSYFPNAQWIVYPETSHVPGFTEKGFKDIDLFLSKTEVLSK